jgi:hypothetical protein
MMEFRHDLRKIVGPHILGPRTGIEADIQAEIDGVGPILNRRPNAVAIPRGGKKLRPPPD